ncbi:MAG: pilus assembly protein CpaE [Salinibacterium sp.]|nr:pilus assembly protein CpaE [Salinibacterium sp.]
MISTQLARALRDSGLKWTPRAGDAFRIDRVEADEEVYILSDMTVEAHDHGTGTVLGFNGTTEWALDSVALEDALWLPHEHQLREFLAATFRSLSHEGAFIVTTEFEGQTHRFESDAATGAYARAILYLLDSLVV